MRLIFLRSCFFSNKSRILTTLLLLGTSLANNHSQVKIFRNIDPDTGRCFPGLVSVENVRQKLSKQLKIDLEDHELLHLRKEPVFSHAELTEEAIEGLLKEVGPKGGGERTPEQGVEKIVEAELTGGDEDSGEVKGEAGKELEKSAVEIRTIGNYLAKITLGGGHTVPLKFVVKKR